MGIWTNPAFLGSVVSGGASLLGNAFGIGRGRRETRRNKELMKYQNSMNIDFWNMQNEYNTPLNQMKRFKEAGLNPALMYGQGNPGNASNLQSANYTPHKETPVDTGAFTSGVLQYQQGKSLEAQRKNTDADTFLKVIKGMVDAGTIDEQKGIVKQQLALLLKDTDKKQAEIDSIFVKMYNDTIKNKAEVSKINLENKFTKHDYDIMQKAGISRNDTLIIKTLYRISKELKISMPEAIQKWKDTIWSNAQEFAKGKGIPIWEKD